MISKKELADFGKKTENPSSKINNPAEVKKTGGLIVDDLLMIFFKR